jgi:hypothetical protein
MWIRFLDPESVDLGSGMENIRIRDKHPGSATLVTVYFYFLHIVDMFFYMNLLLSFILPPFFLSFSALYQFPILSLL